MESSAFRQFKTKTTGGYDATVTSIDTTSDDLLKGEINTPGLGVVSAKWNKNGICSNKTSDFNLKINDSKVADALNYGNSPLNMEDEPES